MNDTTNVNLSLKEDVNLDSLSENYLYSCIGWLLNYIRFGYVSYIISNQPMAHPIGILAVSVVE